MRRLIKRGFPGRPIAPGLQASAIIERPQALTPDLAEFLEFTLDYACLSIAGTDGDGRAYMVEGWRVRDQLYFRAWYAPNGSLAWGYAKFEDVSGDYPASMPLINEIIMVHSAENAAGRTGYSKFSIRQVIPTSRPWECSGCGARYCTEAHGNVYRSCPDHRMVYRPSNETVDI